MSKTSIDLSRKVQRSIAQQDKREKIKKMYGFKKERSETIFVTQKKNKKTNKEKKKRN